jgi:hypothetical protein
MRGEANVIALHFVVVCLSYVCGLGPLPAGASSRTRNASPRHVSAADDGTRRVFRWPTSTRDSADTAGSRIDDIINYGRLADRYGLDLFGVGEHSPTSLGCNRSWRSRALRPSR